MTIISISNKQLAALGEIAKDIAHVSFAAIFIEAFYQPLLDINRALLGLFTALFSWYAYITLVKKSETSSKK